MPDHAKANRSCPSLRYAIGAFVVGLGIAPQSLPAQTVSRAPGEASFHEAIGAVERHAKLIVLAGSDGQSSIAVWPAMQGRVLTSTAEGPNGRSFGWINQSLIASGQTQQHINAVGGEDRLWLGPEGGQFSLFFTGGSPFDLPRWYTPAPIDTEPFDVIHQTATEISFRRSFSLTNYSGTHFSVQIDRDVRLLSRESAWTHLGLAPEPGIKVVAFESENRLTNMAEQSWKRSTGLLSLWVLGQFEAADQAAIVLPFKPGSEAALGTKVKSDYFGPVPRERLHVGEQAVFFRADAHARGKLGLAPRRSRGVIGSFDPEHHVLTIVQYSEPKGTADYVNSAWEIQKEPYKGDVANCYNDGPPSPGSPQLGHFYELESSSPAEVLAPHASVAHTQRTMHLVGDDAQLNRVAKAVLGVTLDQVQHLGQS